MKLQNNNGQRTKSTEFFNRKLKDILKDDAYITDSEIKVEEVDWHDLLITIFIDSSILKLTFTRNYKLNTWLRNRIRETGKSTEDVMILLLKQTYEMYKEEVKTQVEMYELSQELPINLSKKEERKTKI